jgi:hypothetical protein
MTLANDALIDSAQRKINAGEGMSKDEANSYFASSLFNPINQVYFRAGLIACREYMARFVEAQSPQIAASIRANWWPQLGPDLGAPRLINWNELVASGDEFPAVMREDISPTLEALPIALSFLPADTPGITESALAQQPGEAADWQPGTWYQAKNVDDMQRFYRARLPAIRAAAREHGFAVGVHGSERRDFDLIAVPWREGASDHGTLAKAIAVAACGISREGPYEWTPKPVGRVAVSIPICWTWRQGVTSDGHIDLSIMPAHQHPPTSGERQTLTDAQIKRALAVYFAATRLADFNEPPLQASAACFVCGVDTPHNHTLEQRVCWLQAQATRVFADAGSEWAKFVTLRARRPDEDKADAGFAAALVEQANQQAKQKEVDRRARWLAGLDWADSCRTYEGMVADGSITQEEAKRRLGEDPTYSDKAWEEWKVKHGATPPAAQAKGGGQ